MTLSDALVSHALGPLGKRDVTVSPLAWGMRRFRGDDDQAATRRVEAALGSGLVLFGGVDVHGRDNGEAVGAAACAWITAHPARPIPLIRPQDRARIGGAREAPRVRFTRADRHAVLTASRGAPAP
jgi:predicted oxidoreductase